MAIVTAQSNLSQSDPLTVTCPVCYRKPGEKCQSRKVTWGKVTWEETCIHIRRQKAAQRVIPAVQGELFNQGCVRASSELVCHLCYRLYRDHPTDPFILSGIDGRPFFHVLCDGTRAKL